MGSISQAKPPSGDTNWYPHYSDLHDLLNAVAAGPFVTVASSLLPAAQKRACTFGDADGGNDEAVINAAIDSVFSRANPLGGVLLVGPRFNIRNPIVVRANTTLEGLGFNTSLTADNNNGLAMIVNETKNDNNILIQNLSIDGNFASGGSCSGIRLFGSDGGGDGTYDAYPGMNPDMSPVIKHVICSFFSTGVRHGFHMADNVRNPKLLHCEARTTSGHGFWADGSSDGKYSDCITNQSGTAYAGYLVGGGSNQYINCKTAYAGGVGWDVSSSRANLVGCHAQDAGDDGFRITGTGFTGTHLKADSNSRLVTTAHGIDISTDGIINGCNVLDRNQSANRQDRGIDLTGANALWMSGTVSTPAGTNEVIGTPTNSYVRILREGAGVLSVG